MWGGMLRDAEVENRKEGVEYAFFSISLGGEDRLLSTAERRR